MFSISDKVVCVNASPPNNKRLPDALEHGAIYVVRGGRKMADGWAVFLVGIHGGMVPGYGEAGWNPERFRKLTDIQAENASALCANIPDEPTRASVRPTL